MSRGKSNGILLRCVDGLPIQVPREILKCQAELGPIATLVWINILALAQIERPMQIDSLAAQMGLEKNEVSQALACLADRGWINDEGLEIQLTVAAVEQTAVTTETIQVEEIDGYEWLINHVSARVTVPTPHEKRKLLHWMQKKNMSHEVIAVAIEEMFVSAAHPSFPYLEGILRNWYGVGIRTYNDLLENPYLTKVLEPIAGSKEQNPAEQRWREVFPDEFD